MRSRGARTIGRIRALQLFADPLTEEATVDGCTIVRHEFGGTVEAVAVDPSGTPMCSVRVHARAWGDPFYGKYSRNDDRYVYGSKLEVAPEARGRGLGVQMLRVARWVAYDEAGLGLKSLVAPDNAVSLRCHDAVGFDPPAAELRGVRVGSRVLWLPRRSLQR